MDVGGRHAGIFQGGTDRGNGALDQLIHQRLQLGAGQLDVQVLGARRICGDVGQVDVGLRAAGQFDLGLFSGFLQALQGQHVLGQVDALFFLELGDDEVDHALVEVFTAQESVAVGGQHFELLFAIDVSDFDDGHVKGAATQVVHGDLAVALFVLVHTECQGSSGRFVDDALDIQTGNTASVFGGLALGVVEVGGHGDHGLGHFFAEVVFGGLLHLAQNVGADLLRSHAVTTHFHPSVAVVGSSDGVGHQVDVFLDFFFSELAADQALHRVQRVLGVGHRLALGGCAHQHFAVFLVRNDGRGGACAFRVFDHFGRVAFHHSDAAVGGSQVNADDSSHGVLLKL